MNKPRVILKEEKFRLCLERLAEQLIETYNDFDGVCIIGIQEKGVLLSKRLLDIINGLAIEIRDMKGEIFSAFGIE